jgi:vancomycin permeability regulator SanA
MSATHQAPKWFQSKWTKWGFVLVFLFLLFYFGWIPFLKSSAKFLIEEDSEQSCQVAFVLSGNSIDRGKKAVELFKEGKIKKIVCPGGNLHPLFEAMGFHFLESEVTKKAMVKMGIPDSCIELVPFGTSTREEVSLIMDYCHKHQRDTAMIISSEFHTRRIHYSLKKSYAKQGIHFWVVGAPDQKIRYWNWWQDENGLIMINNEWIKLLYYYWKY